MSAGTLAAKLIVSPHHVALATPVVQTEGSSADWGAPTETPAAWEPDPDKEAFLVFPQQATAQEIVAAGRDTGRDLFKLWSEPTSEGSSPADNVDFLSIEGLGILNVVGVIMFQTDGLYRVDAERVDS